MTDEQPVFDADTFTRLEASLPVAALSRTVSDPVARHALYFLRQEEVRTASLDRLADAVAGWTADDGVVTPADRDRVRLRLYHVCLPALDEFGIVAFDSGDESVALDDPPEELWQLLEPFRRRDACDE